MNRLELTDEEKTAYAKSLQVLIGKANLNEFGMGSSTGHSACYDTMPFPAQKPAPT
ncbi:MAG: hypothetical protein AAGU16_10770 [Desulfitobacterium hafniense]|uniref:hypothetical protein n=1 Tax=Desulfitobacterium hafniense TaxID=49338 RepID=UPI00037B6436|nr:hypothetical protein [Desulfitobacterium hafniense]